MTDIVQQIYFIDPDSLGIRIGKNQIMITQDNEAS
jgi:hypothetical protein